jgi:hypothetical protein
MGQQMADSSKKAESQINKFREAACELETDDDEAHFDRVLKKIAQPEKAPPTKGEAKKS